MCGGLAGITSVTVTYPLDIVRTRLSIQSASFADLGKHEQGKLPGLFTTLVLIYRNEGGVIALYRGIIPTVAGVAPYVSSVPELSPWRLTRRVPGRAEFYDLRIGAPISDARRGQEPQPLSKAPGRGYLGSRGTNLHLSIVCCTWRKPKRTTNRSVVTCCAGVSRLTPCPEWATNTNPSGMRFE